MWVILSEAKNPLQVAGFLLGYASFKMTLHPEI
jgi:hypothetical protein